MSHRSRYRGSITNESIQDSFDTINQMFNLNLMNTIISGPYSIESLEQLESVARLFVDNNVKFIRGGTYKPRTSPYDFQGLQAEGFKILDNVRKKYNIFAATEILDPRDVECGVDYAEVIQIGAHNMQIFAILKEVGKIKEPILIKRGLISTLYELYGGILLLHDRFHRLLHHLMCERCSCQIFDSVSEHLVRQWYTGISIFPESCSCR